MALQSTTALATVTLQAASDIVTFSSIPDTYRDLVLVISGEPNTSDSSVNISFNNDTTTANYPSAYAYGDGSSRNGGTLNSTGIQVAYMPNGGKSLIIVEIMDYSVTDKHKATLSRQNDASGWVTMWSGRWANTAAINEIDVIFAQTRTWNSGTTFALFGRIA